MIRSTAHHMSRKRRAVGLKHQAVIEKTDQLAWLRNLVVLAAVLSTAGCLFGYGVAMGLSSRFGLGTGAWYSSTLELISLSGEGFLGLYSMAGWRWEVLSSLLWLMLLYAAAAGSTALLFMLVYSAKSSSWPRLRRWWRKAISVFRSKDPASQSAPSFPSGWEIVMASLAAAAAGFFSLPAVALVLFALLATLSALPVIGAAAGMSYAKVAVLQPDNCVSPPQARMRFERKQELASEPQKMGIGVQCVEVVDEVTKQTVSGKIVVSRPGYVIIYRPAQDDTLLVMVKDAGLRTVAQLPAAATAPSLNP